MPRPSQDSAGAPAGLVGSCFIATWARANRKHSWGASQFRPTATRQPAATHHQIHDPDTVVPANASASRHRAMPKSPKRRHHGRGCGRGTERRVSGALRPRPRQGAACRARPWSRGRGTGSAREGATQGPSGLHLRASERTQLPRCRVHTGHFHSSAESRASKSRVPVPGQRPQPRWSGPAPSQQYSRSEVRAQQGAGPPRLPCCLAPMSPLNPRWEEEAIRSQRRPAGQQAGLLIKSRPSVAPSTESWQHSP